MAKDRFQIKNKIEVAIPGIWNGFPVTDEVLNNIIENNKSAKAPVTRGHVDIKPGDVAEGYITNARLENGSLWFDQILFDKLAKQWENEEFINRSMDLNIYNNGSYMVPSMALLGAEAPGIKGLRTFKEVYSDNKYIISEFKDEEKTVLRFTENIKNEVIMPESKDFEKGFEAGRKAEKDSLTLQFSDAQKTAVEKVEKKFSDIIAEKDAKIKELETASQERESKLFSDKIEEVKKTIPEKDREEIGKKLVEFSEKIKDFSVFSEIVEKYKVPEIEVPKVKTFSNKDVEEVDEFNSSAR